MARQRKGVKFYILNSSALGPTAVLVDRQGRSINTINGNRQDSITQIRRAAKEFWGVPETAIPHTERDSRRFKETHVETKSGGRSEVHDCVCGPITKKRRVAARRVLGSSRHTKTKDDAEFVAHKVGSIRLGLGDFVYTYVKGI